MRLDIAKIIVLQVHWFLMCLEINDNTCWVPVCAERTLYSPKAFKPTDNMIWFGNIN